MEASYLAAKGKVEQLELGMKLKEEAWNGIQEGWKRQEEGWKSKEEAWKMMESMWKSNSMRTEMQAVLPAPVIDVLVQTDSVTRKNEFCQTVQPGGVDFQVQVSMQPERKMTGTQTIKEEVGIPNRPSSNSSKQTKKRKLSSIQTATRNNNAGLPIDTSSSISSHRRQTNEDRTQGTQTQILNDSILNSEVYKIYCQHEDPKEAMTKIQQMKHCSKFLEAKITPSEGILSRRLQSIFKTTFLSVFPKDTIFYRKDLEEYNSTIGIYDAISKYKIKIDNEGNVEKNQKSSSSKKKTFTIEQLFMNSLTKIILVQPNGYEVWFIRDFDKGSGISKWYRGYAYTVNSAMRIAKLSALGIETPASDKTSEIRSPTSSVSWLRFAEDLMKHSLKGIVCHSSLLTN